MELQKSNGAFVGLAVIVIILIIGGIYIWQSKVKNAAENMQSQSGNISTQDSNALNALEQDVSAADPNVGVDVNSVQ